MTNSQKAFEYLKNTDVIKTKRLTLSKPTVEEMEILAEYLLDEDVCKNFIGGAILNQGKDTILSNFKNLEKNEAFFVIKNQNNDIVGDVGYVFIEEDNVIEIGGFIAKPFWGNEYIEEADFAVWLKLREVSTDFITCLSTADFNEKSKRAIKKGLKMLNKMGLSYSIEEDFINWTAEVVLNTDGETVEVKYYKGGTYLYQKTRPKSMVRWDVLKDNKFDMRSVNYKITTS